MTAPTDSSPTVPLAPAGAAPQVPPMATPAPAPKASNGCLKAFVIGSVVCFVLGVLAVGGLLIIGKQAVDSVDKTFGVAAAQDYELKVDACNIDDFNNPEANGTITNKSGHKQAFEIKVDFLDDANVKVSNGLTFSSALDAGQSGTWKVPTFDDVSGKTITCKVSEVSYTPFSS